MTNPVPDVTYGETSVFKFMVLSGPTIQRPATFDSVALTLPELTTSDMTTSVSMKTDAVPRMYGTPAAGTALEWQKSRPESASWAANISGNVLPTDDERSAMVALMGAIGKFIWIERTPNTETKNEGGCASVTSTGKPVPADGVVTFSVALAGYGPKYDDTSTSVPSGTTP